jgi:predicted PurR-regulated permease PerM
LPIDPNRFRWQLQVAALSLLLVVLVIYLLRQFAAIFQPLFIAVFLHYLIVPPHHWLVRRGMSSRVAHIFILAVVVGMLFGVGWMVFDSADQLRESWPEYERKLDALLLSIQQRLPFVPHGEPKRLRDLFQFDSMKQVLEPLGAVLGTFLGLFAALVVVAVYMIFLLAERFTFPARLDRAFGKARADNIRSVVLSINQAVSRYLAVKAFINALVAILTMIVLAAFGVPFVPMWGILTFLLSFIPYLGGVVAAVAPLVVCLLEFSDQLWKVVVIAGLLIAVQQFLGNYVEPRMMGRRLGVSPLLILLALSFWGVLWGPVGMILAIPLLMVLKIVLDNIPETRPLATLMSSE